ncbi:MAG: T9SS type A sorting domain-containing protein [Bacteroidota bacterium]
MINYSHSRLGLRTLIVLILMLCHSHFIVGEGTKNLAPNGTGTDTGTNQRIAYLVHDEPDAPDGVGGDFLNPNASPDERLYVHIKDGETLYLGLRRIENIFGNTNQDLTIIIRENDGTLAAFFTLTDDDTSPTSSTFNTPQAGVIESFAEVLAGPQAVVGASGYNALSFTNSGLGDQDFYIETIQIDGGSTNPADNIEVASWYDLWDFSVYDGTSEKPGRLFSKKWSFTSGAETNRLSEEFQVFVRVPSVVGGVSSGSYIKEVNLGGLEPFSMNLTASATGADIASAADIDADGDVDFIDARKSQAGDIGGVDYDIFINNPDIEIYPTTTLPTVSISNAYFYCNDSGTGGEGIISFTSNQTGLIALFLNLNGEPGFQSGTEDIIIEQEIDATSGFGVASVRWDGLNGLGATVPSGTNIEITGRFSAGPLHIPIYDAERNRVGLNITDVRPETSLDLIYWNDATIADLDSETPPSTTTQLTGTNDGLHIWNDDTGGDETNDDGGNLILVNTWSFGFIQSNTENIVYSFICDDDGDGVDTRNDADGDNDGISDAQEGDYKADTDGDGLPDYVDTDFAGFTDVNGDGVNDNFDQDLDGVPNALDLDSDNDGIPDIIEAGLADADNNGQLDSFTDANGNGLEDSLDPSCTNFSSFSGFGENIDSSIGSINVDNALGDIDASFALFNDVNDEIIVDMGLTIPSGETVVIRLGTETIGNQVSVAQSTSGAGTFTNTQVFANTETGIPGEDFNYVLTADARFIRLRLTTDVGGFTGPDGLSYSFTTTDNPCGSTFGTPLTLVNTDGDGLDNYLDLDSDNDGIVDAIEAGGTAAVNGTIDGFLDDNQNGISDPLELVALSIPDSDADGSIPDYLDLDSDNDGILDNIEAQVSNAIISTAAGDTDGNGLLDVYDPNNGGTLLLPVNTDESDGADYQDTDADGDGVADFIEGWDANIDGFSDLDTNIDGNISDETGHNIDDDNDGIWNIFESLTAPIQNTDLADLVDYQDTDDDNDGSPTSGEDVNGNDDFTDDKTQGQGGGSSIPDYLFRADYDGDAIADGPDADSDNDGITDITESNGESVDPSEDANANGIPNYRDAADAAVVGALSSTADVNSDGVFDVFDSDLDGIPDFLDLDSDNDGIWDAIEADGGSVPNGLNTTTGQFELLDPDNDGLMNFVDTDDVNPGGSSDLDNPNTDGDAFNDYIDIDSDGDGIEDIIESQSSDNPLTLSGNDSDGDGIDDTFDPSDGGVLIDPVNSDGLDLRDYIDTDSDNDQVPDILEGNDADNDGVADHGTPSSTDTDSDGLDDTFDTDNGGTAPVIQNTDGIDERDWRDSDDDNDGILTVNEDANSNGNYADDQTQGQVGSVPDYLFFGDFDGDGIADVNDADSDNDGIPDLDEDNGESIDPSGDEDGDGIPNFRDASDATVTAGLTSTIDSNSDGVYDVFDQDLDGVPDFRDRDSDNDGLPDIIEVGGVDSNGDGEADVSGDVDGDGIPDAVDVDQTGGADNDTDGIDDLFDASESGGPDADGDDIIDSADEDRDGDGLANVVDADPDNNGIFTTTLNATIDIDGDGIEDHYDLDSDGDGIPDIKEAGGTDVDGNGIVDNLTDTDSDGMVDLVDSDNGGTAYMVPDTDSDGIDDFRDKDSDNDGITDTEEAGGNDSNSDGFTDGFASDTDGDGLSDDVDVDNGGIALANVDTDNDGIADFRDLDSDNDGYPDLLEAGGTEASGFEDGVVDAAQNSDPLEDTVPDNVDVDNSAVNGGSGSDFDNDEIDDSFDVDQTGGNDTDGDGIDDTFDSDLDGDGLDDATEADPYGQVDTDGDGNNDFRDLDADGDGIPDVQEFGLTIDNATARINNFVDVNLNGWDDVQEAAVLTPPNFDGDNLPDFRDIDSDNDGLVDLIEAQTLGSFNAISDVDSDNDGLDDAFDPDNVGTLVSLPNTDGTDNEDYRDTDSDADNVPDNIEGANDDRNQFADWDTDSDNDLTDEAGSDIDTDDDGLLDIFDNVTGVGASNIIGSISNGQDSDADGIWDFQDVDDDGDGLLTNSQGGGNEDANSDNDPTNDLNEDPSGLTPNYLFGEDDPDGDLIGNSADADADNDGLANTREDGGTGIDPTGDIDTDGLVNALDFDIDGDGIRNENDTDADASGATDVIRLTDDNGDGIADQFDNDQDGIPDYLDRDSDNDGIADVVEFGLADTDENGAVDSFTDVNGNGLNDVNDTDCFLLTNANATDETTGNGTNPDNAVGSDLVSFAQVTLAEFIILDLGFDVPSGSTIDITMNDAVGLVNATADVFQSVTGVVGTFTNQQLYTATTGADQGTGPEVFSYVLSGNARFIAIQEASNSNTPVNIHGLTFDADFCSGVTGVAITLLDTDTDGVDNHLDLDSDNDGISDNREAQTTADYVASAAGDTDGDGILNVYDEDIAAGNALDPVNTDLLDNEDYLDTDSDNDGVLDRIEAFDGDGDGFANWDTDGDNDPADENGFTTDSDGDGILNLFDNISTVSLIGNIDGTAIALQDTDVDGENDWRDDDDDGDGDNTIDEDDNTNGIYTDDFTQGGGTIPDYLFDQDYDLDGIADQIDFDADNDGILTADEVGAGLPNPFGDSDSDGVFNYLDPDNTGFADINSDGIDDQYDQDRDGLADFYDLDSDNDGINDVLEAGLTDADGDGIVDGFTDSNSDGFIDGVTLNTGTLEASGGGNGVGTVGNAAGLPDDAVADLNRDNEFITLDLGATLPAGTAIGVAIRKPNGTDGSITFQIGQSAVSGGPFTNNQVDTPPISANFTNYYFTLNADAQFIRVEVTTRTGGRLEVDGIFLNTDTPEDFDADGLADFKDLDSDDDGIVDNIEARTTADYVAPSGSDDDNDGIDNAYDTDSGATALTLVNTDSDTESDYRDIDADNNASTPNDGVPDNIEGFDANRNGFSELDTDLDGDLADESGAGVDTDGDGLQDIFDTFAGRGTANITASNADLQDTDSDGIPDFRDTDDDADLLSTSSEDGNTNGDFTDDKTQGGGATPDYLFFNDSDSDGIADGQDVDADNDGIPNDSEYNSAVVTIDPFGDEDGDGIFNFTDNSDPALTSLTDSDNDGIYDEYDKDLDGIPNFFDLDSDNDGIPDATEANGGTLPVGATDNGQFPGTDPDNDDDGLVDAVDTAPSDAGVFGTSLAINDTDGDGTLPDFLDLDSDNDGIVDLVEGGGNDFNGDGRIDGFGDTDGDGLANLVDSDNGGTALPVTSSDADGLPDYRDLDSENDGDPDWDEGFDDDNDGDFEDNYETRRATYAANNGGSPGVYTTDDLDANMIPDYLDDDDLDGRPNFLSPGHPTYVDTDGDGIVDFFDPDNGGTIYGAPDRDSDGSPNVVDGTDIPLPLDFLGLTGEYTDGSVVLTWITANEVDNDRFDIERSFDGVNFEVIGNDQPLNNINQTNTYSFVDNKPQFGTNYYRIRQVDFDGASTTSELIVVFAEKIAAEFILYPNPATDVLNVKTNFSSPAMEIEIVSLSGQRMHTKRYTQDASAEEIKIDVSQYPAGVYYIGLKTDGAVHQFKLVKQ